MSAIGWMDAPDTEVGLGQMMGGDSGDGNGNPALALAGVIVGYLILKFFLERFTNISFAEPKLSILGIFSTTIQAVIGILLLKVGVAAAEGKGINTGGLKAVAGAI